MRHVPLLPYADWLAWREEGLGGSDAAAIMGCSPWVTARELWERRVGLREPQMVNPAMRRGIEMEPYAREEYERVTGVHVPKALGTHDVHEWVRASFDGLNWKLRRVIEIKCPGKKDHKLACGTKLTPGRIPEKYIWQLVHILLVCDLPEIDYVSFDGKTLAIITFKRDYELEAMLLKRLVQFWTFIKTKTAPPPLAVVIPMRKRERERVWSRPKKIGSEIFKVRRSR